MEWFQCDKLIWSLKMGRVNIFRIHNPFSYILLFFIWTVFPYRIYWLVTMLPLWRTIHLKINHEFGYVNDVYRGNEKVQTLYTPEKFDRFMSKFHRQKSHSLWPWTWPVLDQVLIQYIINCICWETDCQLRFSKNLVQVNVSNVHLWSASITLYWRTWNWDVTVWKMSQKVNQFQW